MTVEDITITQAGQLTRHVIKKVTYTKAELKDTIQRAKEIEGNLCPYDPSGNIRDDATISVKNLGGLISEKAVHDLIDQALTVNKVTAKIIDSNFKEIDSSEFQIDHQIQCDDNCMITLETRSSFSYRTKICPDNVINYAFQIIGPYTTKNKGVEHPKDYYAFVFYCLNPNELKATIDSGTISLYFAGGASQHMLVSSSTNLEQNGATYKTVKPITDGYDAPEFLLKIFEKCR